MAGGIAQPGSNIMHKKERKMFRLRNQPASHAFGSVAFCLSPGGGLDPCQGALGKETRLPVLADSRIR